MNYEETKLLEREEKLRTKFTNKSYSQNWKSLRSFIYPVAFIIQLITATLAVALPAYAVKVISGNWIIGFIIGGVILAMFEVVKRIVVNKTMIQVYKKKTEGKFPAGGVALVALILAASVLSSTFGTPILVEEFSPVPSAFNEEAVLSKYDSLRGEASVFWQAQKAGAEAKAKEVFSRNSWKGTAVRSIQPVLASLEAQAKATVDSLNNALAGIAIAEAGALEAGSTEATLARSEREAEKATVGIALAFVTLAFELLFIICFLWLNFYDYREAIDLGLITFKSSKSSKSYPKSSSNSRRSSSKSSKVEVTASQRIGFNSEVEGKIVEEEGKLKILCKTRGGLKAYDKSYLSTLISATKGQNKNSYWREKKQELEKVL